MRPERPNLPVLIGFVMSIAVHVAILVPLLVYVMTASAEEPMSLMGKLSREDIVHPEREPDVPLGLDASTASTLTWIGYDEYREHLARLAEFEQAQFTDEPGEVEREQPSRSEAPVADPLPEAVAVEREPGPLVADEGDSAASSDPQPEPDPEVRSALLTEVLSRYTVAIEQAMARIAEEIAAAPAPLRSDVREPLESPVTPQPQPAPAAPASDGAGRPGDPSDRESDATATVEVPVDDLRAGHPLAAHGLEIKTRRPRFTTLMQLTASPRDPLVELRFAADGKPDEALVVESSGDTRVDSAILSSLYRWRATGEPLTKLDAGKTYDVRIRIVLGRRGR